MTVIGGTDVTEHIRALVDQAPPLTAAQRDQLAAIFRPPIPRPRTPKTPMAAPRQATTDTANDLITGGHHERTQLRRAG